MLVREDLASMDLSVTVVVIKRDETWLFLASKNEEFHLELERRMQFRVPNCFFMPAYKNGFWDGTIKLYNRSTHLLYGGLLNHVQELATEMSLNLIVDPKIAPPETVAAPDLADFTKSLQLPFELADHQIAGILHILNHKRCILLSPTSSGKSAIIYTLIRWLLDKDQIPGKVLLVVPRVSLVSQMRGDFRSYGWQDTNRMCHVITSGEDKNAPCPVYISTWQSIFRMPNSYFEQFKALLIDECHLGDSKSLSSIAEKCTKASWRIGTTGTLKGAKCSKVFLEGILGQTFEATTTTALMQMGFVAQLTVNCLVLKYPEEECVRMKKALYGDEINFILRHQKRNSFIAKMVTKLKGNSLVLFQFVNKKPHGRELYAMVDKLLEGSGRKVFFIYGNTLPKIREQIRQIVEYEKDAIILASIGVFSTGINIKNLENVIFAHPSKSRVTVLQSIGRALRIGRSDKATVWDVVDDLQHKSRRNYALRHFIERIAVYNEQKFDYKIYNMHL